MSRKDAVDVLAHVQWHLDSGRTPIPVHYVTAEGRCSCGRDPCQAIGKHPVGQWGAVTSTNAAAFFADWHAKHPDTNIGLKTGVDHGIVVLDVDVKDGQKGAESLQALLTTHGDLPATLTAQTGSGGWHLLFRSSRPLPNSASTIAPGLDIRGEGGQIVVYPSWHACGSQYRWVDPSVPIAEIPRWLADLAAKKDKEEVSQNPKVLYARNRLLHWVAEIRDAPDGAGRDTLNAAAFELGTLCSEIPLDESYEELKKAAETWASPMDPARVQKTLLDGLADGEAQALVALPEIEVSHDLFEMDEAAVAAFAQGAPKHDVFQRGGSLVQVIESPVAPMSVVESAPRIRMLPVPRTRVLMTSMIQWVQYKKTKEGVIKAKVAQPDSVVHSIQTRGEWGSLPCLDMLSSVPVIRGDGSVIEHPGMDTRSGVFYKPKKTFMSVPDKPTPRDVQIAVDVLTDLFCDFPFETSLDRAGMFACALTMLARRAIGGIVPGFAFDASTPGTGKTYAAEVCVAIGTGEPISIGTLPPSEEETRKVLISMIIEGARVILFDNISHLVQGAALNAFLTGNVFKDRILGVSENFSGPNLSVVLFTGNNLAFHKDMTRRICRIRLRSGERPEERSNFKYPQLSKYILQNIGEIVPLALTILRNAFVDTRKVAQCAWPSFEEWNATVGRAVILAGLGDPVEGLRHFREESDPESDDQANFIRGWGQIQKDAGSSAENGILAREVIATVYGSGFGIGNPKYAVFKEAVEALLPNLKGRQPSTKEVTYLLRRLRDRVADSMRIEIVRSAHGVCYWGVVSEADNAKVA